MQIMSSVIRVDHYRDMESLNKKANIYVKNVSIESVNELDQLMKRFGNVVSCKITPNNYGYV